jgi:hypothetical protein
VFLFAGERRMAMATKRKTVSKKTIISQKLSPAKVAALVRCISKGRLTISVPTVGRVKAGRAQAAYEWD